LWNREHVGNTKKLVRKGRKGREKKGRKEMEEKRVKRGRDIKAFP